MNSDIPSFSFATGVSLDVLLGVLIDLVGKPDNEIADAFLGRISISCLVFLFNFLLLCCMFGFDRPLLRPLGGIAS